LEVASSVRKRIGPALRAVFDRMEDERRAAVVLCDVLELHPEEAAVILRIAPRVVRHEVHQARLIFRWFTDSGA
jgi:DNA-directed RNA polymerase specialized sigma24 family protein